MLHSDPPSPTPAPLSPSVGSTDSVIQRTPVPESGANMPRNKSMTNDGFIRFRSKEGDILPDSSDKEYVLYKAPSGMPRNVTIESAIFNLVSTIVGGGVLSLPFAIDKSGVIVGPFVLILCAVASGFSVYILISGSRRSSANSYEDVMEKLGSRSRCAARGSLPSLHADIPSHCGVPLPYRRSHRPRRRAHRKD